MGLWNNNSSYVLVAFKRPTICFRESWKGKDVSGDDEVTTVVGEHIQDEVYYILLKSSIFQEYIRILNMVVANNIALKQEK